MKVIVGLGNPGAEYSTTRHNAGVMLVDEIYNLQFTIFKDSYGWRRRKDIFVAEFPDLVLVKTAGVFMNESGKIVRELEDVSNLFVAHDDLDIRLGEYKIQFGKGPKLHNGVESVENVLKTKDFWRIRIGIDNRPSFAKATEGEKYVLQKFSAQEREILDRVLHEIVEANFGRPGLQ